MSIRLAAVLLLCLAAAALAQVDLQEDLEAVLPGEKVHPPAGEPRSTPPQAEQGDDSDVNLPPVARLRQQDEAALPDPQLIRPAILPVSVKGLAIAAMSPTQLIRPETDPARLPGARSAEGLSLAAGRNEREQFFLVIRSDERREGVSLTFSALSRYGDEGAIPAAAWSLRRARYVNVPHISQWYGLLGPLRGPLPDPTEPCPKPMALPADATVLLIPELHVPADAAPGRYIGTMTLSRDGETLASVPVFVNVWDLSFPDRPTMQTSAPIPRGAKAPTIWRDLAAMGVTHLKYGADGLKYRWHKETKTLDLDTTEYARQLKVLLDEIGIETVGIPPSLLSRGHAPGKNYLSTGDTVGSEAFWPVFEAFMKQMGDFYRARGWQDRVIWYVMDEMPQEHHALIAEVCRRAKKVFPEVRILLTTNSMPDELAEAIDIWVLPWHFFVTQTEDVARWDQLRREHGLELWAYENSLYTMNANWSLSAMRLYPPMLNKYGYRGNLWWAVYLPVHGEVDIWKQAYPFARSRRDPSKMHFANGQLIYPPRTWETNWQPSLRWEAYRQGLDEFAMLDMLRKRTADVLDALGADAGQRSVWGPGPAVRWWGTLLSTGFRLQTARPDGAFVQRFRQLLAAELAALRKRPRALVDCQPHQAYATPTPTLHIRGLVEAGTKVTVAGQVLPVGSTDRPYVFVHNLTLRPGRNVIPIELIGPAGQTKIFYREVHSIASDPPAVDMFEAQTRRWHSE